MPATYFEIVKYSVFIGGSPTKGKVAGIICHGVRHDPETFNQRVFINFWAKNPPPNQTQISSNNEVGTINLPESHYAWYLDLLRNEAGVGAKIDPDRPDYNCIFVADEPVGEGE